MRKTIMLILVCILLSPITALSTESTNNQNQDGVNKVNKLKIELDNLKSDYEAKLHKIEEYDELMKSALSFAENKNYKKAIELYSSAINLIPGKYVAYNLRGDVYNVIGKKKLAIKDHNVALKAINIDIRTDPSAMNYYSRGEIYYKLGNKDKAEEDLNIACNEKIEQAISLRNKMYLDKTREKKWKPFFFNESYYYSSFFAILSSNMNIKKVGLREEYYHSGFRDEHLSEYKTVVPRYNDILYSIKTMNIACSDFSVSTINLAFISGDHKNLHIIKTDASTYSVILPDSIINDLFDKVCKKTK